MRPQVTVVKNQIHNWIAVVAILSVTLLGAVAINRTSSERDQTTRAATIAVCEQINTGRVQISLEFDRLDTVARSLDGALRVAQREQGHTTQDRIEYARLQALLDTVREPKAVPLINCSMLFER
jgi:hypothetical protein